ncbi:MAG TPA: sigma-70 family RNA polymerase sigma factor [Gaiellaceae bacterium]|nr:sigma-70 family RNA polymerase sigma factor [Gaiellaceae bacterium]
MPELAAVAPSREDERLRLALVAGDEQAFAALVDRYGAALLRFAGVYVRDRAVAEEVVQETWLAVLQGIGRFEGRSSLKTWIFRILANRAKTRAEREGRTVPFSALAEPGDEGDGPSVEPERFLDASHPQWPGHWASFPSSWSEIPENRLLSSETLGCIRAAIEELAPAQRRVILLRDVEGWPAEEVCELLELSEANQRVLLHRARSKVRAALERYLDS